MTATCAGLSAPLNAVSILCLRVTPGAYYAPRVWARDLPWIGVCAALAGCGDDPATAPPTGPTEPMDLAFEQPSADGACLSIGSDYGWHPTVVMRVTNIELSPPGRCGSFLQCGHLALYAGAVLPADRIAADRAACRDALDQCESRNCEAERSECGPMDDSETGLKCDELYDRCDTRHCASELARCDALAAGLALNNETAVPAVTLLTDRLADPVHDGTPLSDGRGDDVLRLRVLAIGPRGDVLHEDGTSQDECSSSSDCEADGVCSEGLCRSAVTADLAVLTVPDCD